MTVQKCKILYFIQLPPPVHGVSIINNQVYKSTVINQGLIKELLEIKFSDQITQLRKFSIKKIVKLFSIIFKLIKSLTIFKPDFVYFSIMPTGIGYVRDSVFVFIIKCFHIRIIYHIHNQGIYKFHGNFLIKFIYRYTFNNSIIIVLSYNMYEKDFAPLFLKNTYFHIVPNGIPIIEYNPKNKIRLNHEFTILFISHITKNKGLETLLASFKLLNEKNPDCKLLIAGEFYNKRIKNRILRSITTLDLQKKVKYLGEINQSKKKELLEIADIFVFPSLNDTFGLVVLEAMQARLPVIMTDSGVWPEILDNLENGILVKKEDINELFEAMYVLLNNKDLKEKIGINSNKLALNYSLENFEQNMSLVFKEIFASKKYN